MEKGKVTHMKTALILPGGGSKGAIELGACKVILSKIVPDLIIGTSVGALNGVVLCNGKDIDENLKKLEMIWEKASKRSFFPLNPEVFFRFHHARSFYSNKGIYNQLKKYISVRNLEELDIPLHVNCTNMISGEPEFFTKGKLFDPVVASCSSPPFFPPVKINGVPYIDGSISSYFGVKEAVRLKCNKIILINVRVFEKYAFEKNNLSECTHHATALVENQLIRDELDIAKKMHKNIIEIRPPIKNIHLTDFRFTKELIKDGEEAAEKVKWGR